ncbi:hypothetical protein LTR22_015492 [Elasticomyces elasticus]|nr:hypothetical protein LTR22_015492 [Elasticomyces elasticus]KAK5754563.1 hypothetical protein LTS12_015400 [Elasticomyces elasticus]
MAGPSSPDISTAMSNEIDFSDLDFSQMEPFTDNPLAGTDDTINPESLYTPVDGTINPESLYTPVDPYQNSNILYEPQPQFTPQPSFMLPPSRPQSVMPMQMMPTPPPGPPGACYHPAIGWYFPAQPMPVIMHASTPVPQIAIPVPYPMNASAPHTTKQSRNRKHRRDSIESLDISSDEEEQPVRTKRKKARKTAKRTPERSMNARLPSIVQACVCNLTEAKIPRPRNKFILYRQAMSKSIANSSQHGKSQISVSKQAGEAWRAESAAVKQKFEELAARELASHAAKYPGWKYQPNRNKDSVKATRVGKKDCTCAARSANDSRLRDANFNLPANDLDAPCEVYDMPYAAPTAPMVQQTQEVRRSSRARAATVSYREPSDSEDFETTHIESPPSPKVKIEKHRPTAIITPFNSPPATNTRAKSISRESLDLSPVPEDLMDFAELFGEDPNQPYDYDEYVDFNSNAESDVVVEPSRRKSMKTPTRKSPRTPKSATMSRRSTRRSPQQQFLEGLKDNLVQEFVRQLVHYMLLTSSHDALR